LPKPSNAKLQQHLSNEDTGRCASKLQSAIKNILRISNLTYSKSGDDEKPMLTLTRQTLHNTHWQQQMKDIENNPCYPNMLRWINVVIVIHYADQSPSKYAKNVRNIGKLTLR